MSTPKSLTDKDIVSYFEEDGYDAFHKKKGVSDVLKEYMERNCLKTSTASTNAEKWKRIVRDCVEGEQHLAQPHHYRSIPLKFRRRPDFLYHHYINRFKVLTSSPAQFIYTALLLHFAHKWSHQLYMIPLRFFPFYNSKACSDASHMTGCDWLNHIQQYSFKGENDLKKYVVIVASQQVVRWVTNRLSPYRTA